VPDTHDVGNLDFVRVLVAQFSVLTVVCRLEDRECSECPHSTTYWRVFVGVLFRRGFALPTKVGKSIPGSGDRPLLYTIQEGSGRRAKRFHTDGSRADGSNVISTKNLRTPPADELSERVTIRSTFRNPPLCSDTQVEAEREPDDLLFPVSETSPLRPAVRHLPGRSDAARCPRRCQGRRRAPR